MLLIGCLFIEGLSFFFLTIKLMLIAYGGMCLVLKVSHK